MHTRTPGTTAVTVTRPLRTASIGAGAATALLGTSGLTVAVTTGVALGDTRAVYIAALAALILAVIAGLVYGGIRAFRAVLRDHTEHRAQIRQISVEISAVADARTDRVCGHLARLEQAIDQKVDDGLQNRLDQLENIVINDHERSAQQLAQVAEALTDLRSTMAAFIEELHRREQRDRDELERRRNRRNC